MSEFSLHESAHYLNHKESEDNARQPFRWAGILAVLCSCLCLSTAALFVKILGYLNPLELSLSRFFVQFLILLPILTFKKDEIDLLGKDGLKKYVWLRGITGSIGLCTFYMAISHLPVADAVTLIYLRMAMVPFLAWIFLKEKIAWLEIVLAIISLFGVILIARPSFIFPHEENNDESSKLLGVSFGLTAAFFQAVSIVILRKLGDTSPFLSVGYYSFCGAVLTMATLIGFNDVCYPCFDDLLQFFSVGALGLAGVFLLTLGVQRERAGAVTVLMSLQVIFTNILQVTVLGVIPTTLSIIGTALILCSSTVLALYRGMSKNPCQKA